MIRTATILTTLALAVATPALAKNDKGHKNGHSSVQYSHCPPGLAKKNPPCVPPGQAKKQYRNDHDDRDHSHSWYHRGDRITRDYVVIRNPHRYGLDPNYIYYSVADRIYQMDSKTREVLNFIGATADLLD
ncbi:excinuclease ABC subunit A [Roseobacter sp. N2S]|uniref:excinuclease ABC subunit A n=1 Tax=Roseobacter sp. N2S TaxID=2663844 RepID=UPI0028581D8E|nr:excinuclease ABC subunit A [Roseobacter sp. N2S]MDR6265443.1 hypothetical protein [Roseobacter sp. N2S]